MANGYHTLTKFFEQKIFDSMKIRIKQCLMRVILGEERYFKYQLKQASSDEIAILMRTKFYHCGENVRLYTTDFGTEPYLINIGDNVTVASNVHFVTHDVSCFNMARFLGFKETCMDKVGPITLHDNCFIGTESLLMLGCSVGRNSVIAAGSIVTHTVPDNQVWGGVPAKFIMTVEEYATKIKENTMRYPWVNTKTLQKKDLTEEELVKMRQSYFFKA